MIHLSDDAIQKYQQLYKARFGKDISKEEAYDQGSRLIRLIKAVYGGGNEKVEGKTPPESKY